MKVRISISDTKWVKVPKPKIKCPDRIRTGIKNQSIQNPYTQDLVSGEMPDYVQAYAGPIEKYKFTHPSYEALYKEMKDLLAEMKWKFYAIYVRVVPRDDSGDGQSKNVLKYAAVVGKDPADPDFLWYRYDAQSPTNSRNMVFCGGRTTTASEFVRKGWKALKM